MMCVTCGCSNSSAVLVTGAATGEPDAATPAQFHEHDGVVHSHSHDPDHDHRHEHSHRDHDHDHQHGHAHDHDHPHGHEHAHEHDHAAPAALHAQVHGRTITLEADILAKNQLLAERNRGWLAGRDILALNLVSSPGSGKTSLLERTIREVGAELSISVVEGDQATLNDARRIRTAGAPAVQINTGSGCHLDADMLARGLAQLKPPPGSVVMVENVGNLVCPALFDLGEHAKVVILSVTEGEDKPAKYPHMFKAASLMLLNKVDLLPHLRFDVQRCIAYAREVNPGIKVLQVSAQSGEGMQAWYAWLRHQLAHRQIPNSDAAKSAIGPLPTAISEARIAEDTQ